MLVKGPRRLLVFAVGALAIFTLISFFYADTFPSLSFHNGYQSASTPSSDTGKKGDKGGRIFSSFWSSDPVPDVSEGASSAHRSIFSVSTKDRKFFPISFGHHAAINPNILPHPSLNDTWIIIAQQQRSDVPDTVWFAELVCDARFSSSTGALECLTPPVILPIAATPGDKCTGDLDWVGMNVGPHDARAFYGPENPYVLYGETGMFTCFTQWVQDLRMVVDWGYEEFQPEQFRTPTEVQRPQPYGQVEKNWFLFFDGDGLVYGHYDLSPKRAFAELSWDGSVGPDLAPLAAASDERCMNSFMPRLAESDESIHQATNSLSITLCNRKDAACRPNNSNTFIFTIFQHKSYHSYHSVYEPYVMLFARTAPFQIHGLGMRPIWINGRGGPGKGKLPGQVGSDGKTDAGDWNQTEMFYVTSISWKEKGMKYHGYLDDVLFLAFGVEDVRTAGIDVLAADLMQDLGLCENLP